MTGNFGRNDFLGHFGFLEKLRFVAIYLPACAFVGVLLRFLGVPELAILAITTGLYVAAFFSSATRPRKHRAPLASKLLADAKQMAEDFHRERSPLVYSRSYIARSIESSRFSLEGEIKINIKINRAMPYVVQFTIPGGHGAWVDKPDEFPDRESANGYAAALKRQDPDASFRVVKLEYYL